MPDTTVVVSHKPVWWQAALKFGKHLATAVPGAAVAAVLAAVGSGTPLGRGLIGVAVSGAAGAILNAIQGNLKQPPVITTTDSGGSS